MKVVILILSFVVVFSMRLKTQGDAPDKPILLNVTYESSWRDLDEQRKYSQEYVNYVKKVKEVEDKFNKDIDLFKRLMNIQNLQIQKLNEIIEVNSAIGYHLIEKTK